MMLDVLICTFGADGINRVAEMNLPVTNNVRYIVSWQKYRGAVIPKKLAEREDVMIIPCETMGLSNNRNHAFSYATAELCLIADDDLRYTSEGLVAVMNTFENNEELDIATFRHSGDSKWFPDEEFDLARCVKGYYVTSFEIAFRRLSVGGLSFNPHFGVGAKVLHAGEEQLFIYQALKRGLQCRYYPITIVEHCGLSTAHRPYTRGVLMSQGAYLAIAYPGTALLRILLFAWRSSRRGLASFFSAVYHLFAGYIYCLYHFDRDGNSK